MICVLKGGDESAFARGFKSGAGILPKNSLLTKGDLARMKEIATRRLKDVLKRQFGFTRCNGGSTGHEPGLTGTAAVSTRCCATSPYPSPPFTARGWSWRPRAFAAAPSSCGVLGITKAAVALFPPNDRQEAKIRRTQHVSPAHTFMGRLERTAALGHSRRGFAEDGSCR